MITGCPSELTLSMHADRALAPNDAVATELHVASCAQCRERLAGLRSEVSVIAAALAHGDEAVVVPKYRRPVSRLTMAATAVAGMFVAALVGAAPDLIGGLLSGPVGWFNPFDDVGSLANLGLEAAIYVAKHGVEIMTSMGKTALMAAFTTLVGWLAFARRRRTRGPLMLALVLGIVALQPAPSHAVEIRHDEKSVSVPAGETIDDTLIAVGETVDIDGVVTGDLIAVGKRITIRGSVGGQIFTAGQSGTIDGEVGGSVLGLFSDTLAIESPRIAGNVYAAGGESVDVGQRAKVEQNVIVAGGDRVLVAGSVGRDVLGGSGQFEVTGTIGGKLTAYAKEIVLREPARIAGDVVAYVSREDRLSVAPGVIGGELKKQIMAPPEAEVSEYRKGEFYSFQLFRYAAAFLAGLVVLALVPRLQRVDLDSFSEASSAGGIGLVALVAAPIIALITMATVIAIPIAVLGLMLWMAGVYLAKIVFGYFVGARILESDDAPRHFAIALALGLAIVLVLVNLPFIGGLLNFVMTIVGLGMLVLFVWRSYMSDRTVV